MEEVCLSWVGQNLSTALKCLPSKNEMEEADIYFWGPWEDQDPEGNCTQEPPWYKNFRQSFDLQDPDGEAPHPRRCAEPSLSRQLSERGFLHWWEVEEMTYEVLPSALVSLNKNPKILSPV